MTIKIRNAYQHNLKNISLDIPRNKLIVFSGVSGSGKSSLLFDTIFAESQRQYLESLNVYARKRLPKFSRPKVDEIMGISPAIMIDQKRLGKNLRSTIGTVTEIYTYLRLLFSRCGSPRIGDSILFSFNTPEGMCPVCKGLGEELVLDKDRLINWGKSLNQEAIKFSEYRIGGRRWNILKISGLFDMDKQLKDFTEEELDKLLFSKRIGLNRMDERGFVQNYGFEGVVTGIKRRRIDKRGLSSSTLDKDKGFFKRIHCQACQGSRLNKKARSAKVGGKTIVELVSMELIDLYQFIKAVSGPVADPIVEKITESLSNLIDIGVGYLSLNRSVSALSGGESQRVKMARQLGTNLIEMIYILDEPSIGLHPKDIFHLLTILKKLKDQGNSVLVVEHDPSIIKTADHIIDLGLGAGSFGGKIVFQGTLAELQKCPDSITSQFLRRKVYFRKNIYRQPKGFIPIKNASIHNLKNISVDIPAKVFVCITGVAGSGKSNLINDVFAKERPEAIVVDQSAVGRSIRSNPATYIGVFDLIRKEFASQTGKRPSIFSFNSKGACSKCRGLGFKKIEMHFLDSVVITCSKCEGQRYAPEILKLKYKNKNIAEVLKMTAKQAYEFFDNKEIKRRLKILQDVGLGYLELGQPLNTLSGGEAQRIKLVRELHKKGNIYILDEPTIGLHMADIEKLLKVLNRLVDLGNSVIVIEHNLDIISQADWIIDLGPEGGNKGGEIVAQGTPKEIIKNKKSYTGQYLREK